MRAAPGRPASATSATAPGLAAARRLGLEATVYTVNKPERMRELAALGVTGILDRRSWLCKLFGQAQQPRALGGKLAVTCIPIVSAAARVVARSAVIPRSPLSSSIRTPRGRAEEVRRATT